MSRRRSFFAPKGAFSGQLVQECSMQTFVQICGPGGGGCIDAYYRFTMKHILRPAMGPPRWSLRSVHIVCSFGPLCEWESQIASCIESEVSTSPKVDVCLRKLPPNQPLPCIFYGSWMVMGCSTALYSSVPWLDVHFRKYAVFEVAGRLRKKFEEKALMNQKWLKDEACLRPGKLDQQTSKRVKISTPACGMLNCFPILDWQDGIS